MSESLKQRLAKQKKDLASRGKKGNVIFIKEGTLRVRILPVGKENDFATEVTQFYLNEKLKGIYSPATLNKPCALMEKYQELKDSKDKDDKEFAKKLVPKHKYLIPVLVYKDMNGKEVDKEQSGKLLQITGDLYGEIINHYLDENEWGDMTDPLNGYDIKITRVGKGQYDTEYSMSPCKNTPAPAEWRKPVDLEEMLEKIIPTYEETEEILDEFLSNKLEGEDKEDKVSKQIVKETFGKKPIVAPKKVIILKKK